MSKDQFVEKLDWITADLVHMLQIRPNDKGHGGCNFPILLYVLACMEWVGFLLRECNASKTQLDNTTANIKVGIDNLPAEYHHSVVREFIVTLFRNGLVHQFGPKSSGVSRGNNFHPPVAFIGLTPVIDADQLANDFIVLLESVNARILSGELDYETIRKKVEFIFVNDNKELAKILVLAGLVKKV